MKTQFKLGAIAFAVSSIMACSPAEENTQQTSNGAAGSGASGTRPNGTPLALSTEQGKKKKVWT